MQNSVRLRLAEPADAAAICALHVASIRQLCAKDYSPEQIEAWAGPKRPEHYLWSIGQRCLFVAEMDGKIIGIGEYNAAKTEVCALYVHPAHAGQGVGTLLFQRVRDELRALGLTQAQLDASLTSVPFYLSQGAIFGERCTHTLHGNVSIPCVRMRVPL